MITAIITNYKQGKFALTALQSLYTQTLKPNNIIIVDDASPDDSVKLIKEAIKVCEAKYPPIPTQVVVRETNGKPAGARNSGIKLCNNSDYICFLDIDDYYYADKIKQSVEVLEKNPTIGMVYTDYDMINTKTGKTVREFKHPYDFQFLWQTCIVSTNSIVRKSVFDKVGLFDEKLYGVEDYQMWLRIGKEYMVYHIAEALFCYRIHGENLSVNHAESMNQQIPVFKQELAHAWQLT